MADSANTTDAPEIDRRMAIIGLATGAATGMVIFDAIDPVVEAVQAYRAGMDDYNANAPVEDELANAYAAQTYEPPMRVLMAWDQPATTKEGALAAIEMALEERAQQEESPVETAMLRAVHGFLKA